jgi:predicted ATPase
VHRRGYRFLAAVGPTSAAPSGADIPSLGRATINADDADERRAAGTHLVGREAEFRALGACLEKALRGDRQLVFVTGEPGIGKTALVTAFLAQVTSRGDCWIGEGQCIEHFGSGEAYLPVFAALHHLSGAPGGVRLRNVLEQYAPSWLAQIPGLLDAATLETLALRTQGATRERMMREMAEAAEFIAEEQPVIVVLEDLHWSDAATVELLSFLARRRAPARLLVLGTYRPADAAGNEHVVVTAKDELAIHGLCVELPLARLSEAGVGRYVTGTLPGHRLPGRLVSQLHTRTGGNPLFLVNVVQDWVTEGVVVKTEGRWQLGRATEDAARRLPRSIKSLIERQLTRLGPSEQRRLEAASVAGEEFSASIVAAAVTEDLEKVEEWCAVLVRRHILRSRGTIEWPDGTVAGRYAFAHALYQEVLYDRIAAGRRAELHRKIGRRLETAFSGHVEDIAAELATHFGRGGDLGKAVPHLEQAARKVLRRSAPQEALGLVDRALEMLQKLPDPAERARHELALRIIQGQALAAIKGYMARDAERAYTRVRELSSGIDLSPAFAPVLFGFWAFHLVRAEHRSARDVAEQLRHLAAREPDPALRIFAHLVVGVSLLCTGELVEAHATLERERDLYDAQRHRALAVQYGVDPWVANRAYAAMALWLLGRVDQAVQTSDAATAHAHELGHPLSIAFSLNLAALLFIARREPQRAEARAGSLIALSSELGLQYWIDQSAAQQGWALIQQGRFEEGVARTRAVLDTWRAEGKGLLRPSYLGATAEAHGAMGQLEHGIDLVDEALAAVDRTGEHWWESELRRLKGELTLKQAVRSMSGPRAVADAEACFADALAVARRQGARSLELRAAVSLARLWQARDNKKKKEAHDLLKGTLDAFTEGYETADVQEAQAVLDAGPAIRPGSPRPRGGARKLRAD